MTAEGPPKADVQESGVHQIRLQILLVEIFAVCNEEKTFKAENDDKLFEERTRRPLHSVVFVSIAKIPAHLLGKVSEKSHPSRIFSDGQ